MSHVPICLGPGEHVQPTNPLLRLTRSCVFKRCRDYGVAKRGSATKEDWPKLGILPGVRRGAECLDTMPMFVGNPTGVEGSIGPNKALRYGLIVEQTLQWIKIFSFVKHEVSSVFVAEQESTRGALRGTPCVSILEDTGSLLNPFGVLGPSEHPVSWCYQSRQRGPGCGC